MRIVVALGGNAISLRGEVMTIDNQRANLREAAGPLAEVGCEHELVITHGNGPQVGLLALQNAAFTGSPAFPLDVLGAQTQGLLGYLIELELRNVLHERKTLTTVMTMVSVSRDDPAFANPTKYVGPVYTQQEADVLGAERGWQFALDGDHHRRVVPSPAPKSIIQVDSVKQLLDGGHIVISTGGGGIPVEIDEFGQFSGVEVVVDKDASSAMLADAIDADLLVLATDADAVMLDWGTPEERAIAEITPEKLGAYDFAAGSMGPKVAAARAFVESGRGMAVIGRLSDLPRILAGEAGTAIRAEVPGGVRMYPSAT